MTPDERLATPDVRREVTRYGKHAEEETFYSIFFRDDGITGIPPEQFLVIYDLMSHFVAAIKTEKGGAA